MAIDEREFPGADMEGYVREAMTFAGVDEADLERVRRTAPLVLKHETELTSALYEHFLKFPHSAKFFLAPDGTPDAARIERRKHSLGRWLRETGRPAAALLEGGYHEDLPLLIDAFLSAWNNAS